MVTEEKEGGGQKQGQRGEAGREGGCTWYSLAAEMKPLFDAFCADCSPRTHHPRIIFSSSAAAYVTWRTRLVSSPPTDELAGYVTWSRQPSRFVPCFVAQPRITWCSSMHARRPTGSFQHR